MRIGAEVADPATPARVRKVSALRELLGIAMAKETRAPSLARWALTTLRGSTAGEICWRYSALPAASARPAVSG